MCMMNEALSSLEKGINYLRHISIEKWQKMEIYVYVLSIKFKAAGVDSIM